MKYSLMGIKLSLVNLVTPEIRAKFAQLHKVKELSRKMKRDDIGFSVLSDEIKKLRTELKATQLSVYNIRIKNGRYFYEEDYLELPEPMSFKSVADEYISQIKNRRLNLKAMKQESRSILGFQYKMVGNTFTEPLSIKKVEEATDPMRRISVAKSPHPKIKGKYVGIELELMCNFNRETLCRAFIKQGLAGYVYVKGDSSIQAELPTDVTHEVTVLCKQEDVTYIMTRVCNVLNSKECGAKVNNTCGFHLHLDMRNRDAFVAYNNLVRGLPLLNKMVPSLRVKGREALRYCKQNTTADLKTYFPDGSLDDIVNGDRYQAINPVSLTNLKTLEVRLHGGTTNLKKILMWTEICVKLVDNIKLNVNVDSAESFAKYVYNDTKVTEFINKRVDLFNKTGDNVDTKTDHVMSLLEVG